MTSTEKKIPFKVEFSRILELLAHQIYQSPLALLRENAQNAFDAIRMRQAEGQDFEPAIHVTVDREQASVSDNGIRDDCQGNRGELLVRREKWEKH